jgi:DNA-directed RNA polymerase specialized sigma24 family protein
MAEARSGRTAQAKEHPSRTAMPDEEFSAFYQAVFLPLVRRASWRHGLSKEDARDCVQDAFLLAIEKIDAARNPKAWLIQVVDHLALNLQRKHRRRSHLLSKWTGGTGCDQSSEEDGRPTRRVRY